MKRFLDFLVLLLKILFKQKEAKPQAVITDIFQEEPVLASKEIQTPPQQQTINTIDSEEHFDQVIVPHKKTKLLSKNFYIDEFQCRCGGCKTFTISSELIKRLQMVRDEYGKPITVTSGYRCPAYNKKVKGVPNSYHIQGLAVDIAVISSLDRFLILKAATKYFTGIGVAKKFIHLDLRDSSPVFWTY